MNSFRFESPTYDESCQFLLKKLIVPRVVEIEDPWEEAVPHFKVLLADMIAMEALGLEKVKCFDNWQADLESDLLRIVSTKQQN